MLAMVGACGSDAPSDEPAPATLQRIFDPSLIGTNVAYTETLTGPAVHTFQVDTFQNENTYRVDGCTVIIGVGNGTVLNVGIVDYSSVCRFDVAPYFAGTGEPITPTSVNFGSLYARFPGTFSADCLMGCGNAYNPSVWMWYGGGSRADNFNNLLVSVPLITGETSAAANTWRSALIARFGEDYVLSRGFACGENLNDTALAAFRDIPPTTVRVGAELAPPPAC